MNNFKRLVKRSPNKKLKTLDVTRRHAGHELVKLGFQAWSCSSHSYVKDKGPAFASFMASQAATTATTPTAAPAKTPTSAQTTTPASESNDSSASPSQN
ncbi:hypothetical protein EUTSA_v10001259mg [Eutrema salsugineum]|uniref:Uncharacterized protein n=1 Tax=Eutrema salsugineum TaxID=72664 RepID=V4L711_EUTSA|nr:hypothetical protein EUTSA_v10001259mg [Eutrema salsugineum]